MYLRMTSGTENLPCAYAYIEFTNQPTVPIALQNNGIEFKGRCLRFAFLDLILAVVHIPATIIPKYRAEA
ncbi:unnamed protein product [Gongylonema pulchrum]|uniref:RRM domain-containing protein n=1 Tax=Gongylonema pulchrum TaxID=637853 RepID=A0A183EHE5_9BILA|nr:unnamed protein product [Gongylonema pulchrum]